MRLFAALIAAVMLPSFAWAGDLAVSVRTLAGKPVADAVVMLRPQGGVPKGPIRFAWPYRMAQQKMQFAPFVLLVPVGAEVSFPNLDLVLHHVYSFSPAKTFELPLYKGEDAPAVLLDKVGVVKIGCNIHDWMSGIILVLPSAHFAVTDANGRFVLEDLPPGNYVVAAWHAQSKLKPEEAAQSVTLAHEPAHLDFTLPLAPARPRPSVHGVRAER